MARERYLIDDDEKSPIHDNTIKLTTTKQKIENWWFYNSVKLIAVVIIAILIFSIVFTVMSKEKPDYYIGLLVNKNFDSAMTDLLEEQLSVYGEDLNGDGKVIVEFVNCSIGNGDANSSSAGTYAEIGSTRFLADLNKGSSLIWICDEFGYIYSDNENYTLFADMFDSENPAKMPFNEIKAFDDIDFSSYEDMFLDEDEIEGMFSTFTVSFRDAIGTATGSAEKDKYYQDCLNLLENFKNGTVVNG